MSRYNLLDSHFRYSLTLVYNKLYLLLPTIGFEPMTLAVWKQYSNRWVKQVILHPNEMGPIPGIRNGILLTKRTNTNLADSNWREIAMVFDHGIFILTRNYRHYQICSTNTSTRAIAQLGRATPFYARQRFSGESSMQSKTNLLLEDVFHITSNQKRKNIYGNWKLESHLRTLLLYD